MRINFQTTIIAFFISSALPLRAEYVKYTCPRQEAAYFKLLEDNYRAEEAKQISWDYWVTISMAGHWAVESYADRKECDDFARKITEISKALAKLKKKDCNCR